MSEPQYMHQISTTEELLQSEYKFLVSSEFSVLNDLGTDEVMTMLLWLSA